MIISQLSVQIDTDEPTAIYVFAHDVAPAPIGILRLEINEPSGWVGALFVEEAFRGKGVGKALMQRAEALCQGMGKTFISLTVADKNEGAQRLYKSLGFSPYMAGHEGYMQYVKPLPNNGNETSTGGEARQEEAPQALNCATGCPDCPRLDGTGEAGHACEV